MLDHDVAVVGQEGDLGGGRDEGLTGLLDLGRGDPIGTDESQQAEGGEGSEGDGLLAHDVLSDVLGNIALVL